MIEHFKKFDAEDVKSILPLSFSQITDFAFNRERWALRRIFGYEFPSNAAAERGKAVESGLNMILNGLDHSTAKVKMHEEFEANVRRFNDPKTLDEREKLNSLLDRGVQAFKDNALTWNLTGYQEKIEIDILGIPLIGYTDFKFEDKNTKEDFYIDLKTTGRKPTGVSMAHAMQQSIYQKGTNANQKLWYLVGKKTGADFYDFSIEDYNTPFKVCEQIVCAMANYLKSVDTLDDVKNTLVPNPDDWIWREEALIKARKEVWGY